MVSQTGMQFTFAKSKAVFTLKNEVRKKDNDVLVVLDTGLRDYVPLWLIFFMSKWDTPFVLWVNMLIRKGNKHLVFGLIFRAILDNLQEQLSP